MSYGSNYEIPNQPPLQPNWWKTSIINREKDIRDKISQYKGFTKKELAYAPWNYFLGSAKCQNCVFFNEDNQPCQAIQYEPVQKSGLCHFVTSKDPEKPFFIESVYSNLPPNGTWYIGIGAAGAITAAAVTAKVLTKGKKAT